MAMCLKHLGSDQSVPVVQRYPFSDRVASKSVAYRAISLQRFKSYSATKALSIWVKLHEEKKSSLPVCITTASDSNGILIES